MPADAHKAGLLMFMLRVSSVELASWQGRQTGPAGRR